MARTLILLACLVAATVATPLAAAETYIVVDLPDNTLTLNVPSEIVVGPFCQTSFFCYDQYVCVERAEFCCPKMPPGVDEGPIYCKHD